MKVSGWLHIEDGGDGSASANFFSSEEKARKSCRKAANGYGQCLCDNVVSFEFEVDENGVVKDGK